GTRFADFHTAFATAGLTETRMNYINGYLWHNYAESSAGVGSGISAFPSVHVGVATLTLLYLVERSRHLLLPGIAFLAVILVLSVYTGYHYAIDGYFSIVFMIVARQMVAKWQSRRAGRSAHRSDMPAFGDLAADGR